ncbi:hypothetical protein EI94DRAFT_1749742, partial [Lactarius quietus]
FCQLGACPAQCHITIHHRHHLAQQSTLHTGIHYESMTIIGIYSFYYCSAHWHAQKSILTPVQSTPSLLNLWVLLRKSYGLWGITFLWVMGLKSPPTKSVDRKRHGV